ncbi:Dynein heavy chain and region D6 of dynein motor/Ankyrin repeats (3 copies)/Ankyrin repeat, putative [Leishmania donovani]|uniref:Dynein heavy chain and region D6 of dynein motor/Ankyrin repeats (3 copies)/Ankyrin repeat, putative n=1 Tax=Leishmania donovani TaxID=5661 RepID=A0A3Q8IIK7_LEIDO|nr:Dynein heavy chain and region D6 of dynein motor/Ankyrin repeats (3 copies)/Ankyrin repeat, putative [Leishmania donovani]
MASRAIANFSADFSPLKYVERAVKNSDCRTPIIFVQQDGDPFQTVCYLAKKRDSAVWSFDVAQLQSMQNVADYIDVGINNGDWVYITNCDLVSESYFRDVARTLYKILPEPHLYPRREVFRCFFGVTMPFDLNAPVGLPFPPLFMHSSLVARPTATQGTKWSRIMPAEKTLFSAAALKHQQRREVGRESDSESDLDEGDRISGVIFYRAVERSRDIDQSTVTLAKHEMVQAVEAQDDPVMRRLVSSGEVDLSRKLKDGMTPLQYACCKQLTGSVRTLLSLGADPNAPRESDGRPPLFMSIDDMELAKMLVEGGANLFSKFEGHRTDTHPDTAPDVAAYLDKERKCM